MLLSNLLSAKKIAFDFIVTADATSDVNLAHRADDRQRFVLSCLQNTFRWYKRERERDRERDKQN